MTDRSARCTVCGRLAPALSDGVCSARCAELATRGYSSPAVAPELAAPPAATLDCRVVIEGDMPAPLPHRCVSLGALRQDGSARQLVRIAADEWGELEETLTALRESVGAESVSVLSTQQFVSGGLVASGSTSTPAEGGSG